MKKILCGLILSLAFPLFSATRSLSEKDLIAWSKINAPQLEEIQSALLLSETQKNIVNEKYAFELFGRGSYSETQERPIIEFIPVFSPVKQAQLGLRKNFSKGFETQLLATTQQQSASSSLSGKYNNVTTTVLSFTVQMDLWKNLLGRVSEADKRNSELEASRAALDKEIKTRAFEITLRRIFWSLVAVEEQLKITEKLKITAGEQLADSKKRLQSSIGDAGDVARYEAQLANRNAQVIFLGFQKENYVKQLKTLLPDLGQDDITLAQYDIESTIMSVLECSNVISNIPTIPFQNTKYDELTNILREVRGNRSLINKRYSDVDVKLFGTVKSTGVGSDKLNGSEYRGSYGDAYRDMKNNNRTGYEAGVNFTLPLGDAKDATKETKTLYDEKRFKAMIDQTDAQLVSTHTQLSKSIKLLQEVIANQRMSTAAFEKRLKVVRQKYNQARISVNDLIIDQDALMVSELNTIDAQLQVVNVLLDYLMVFQDTPCTFNRI